MKRRIFGLETEYGIVCTSNQPNGKSLSIQNTVMYLFREIIHGRMYPDVFLENGARFYQDIGCHPEYATPECDDVIDLVIHDKAGERIVAQLARSAERRMKNDGINGKISVFKNNTDTPGNTFGCHENYLMDRRVTFRQLASKLIPFFVTRQVFSGAGKINPEKSGSYAISQRAQHIREEISIATTTARGIINTRDEPHADREKYRRLHVIVGDSNMSEFTNFLKISTTNIVLRMIEDGFIQQRFNLRNAVRAIQQISDDISCTRKIELEDGKWLSAVELQQEYLEIAKRYLEQNDSDFITDQTIMHWEYVLKCLSTDPMRLDQELDWVIKKKLVDKYASSRKLKWSSAKVAMLDLQYHNIRTDQGLYYKLERDGLVRRITEEKKIEHAIRYPPETTRAKFRGRFVQLCNEKKIACGVNWSYIQLYEPYQKLFLSTDPLQAEYEEASKMIYSI
ncbi:MAG: proteasome accessory factor PafA2 family protein [Candidatus Poribacteria bacterium]|jgi:proteasome accessory factor A|nr:proteasome accessory factor PafA2 family protein [Candidatus Poribacteria bacterium]MDP6961836.1 proteasome accessory factor PafA2 family protein [Dehalococcoidia bacterium]